MLLSETISANVTRTTERPPLGARIGTVGLSISEARREFGAPNWEEQPVGRYPGDTKVTIGWYFETPRGRLEVRDYWWNGRNELSIAGESIPNDHRRGHKAALWLCAYLRRRGIKAATKMRAWK